MNEWELLDELGKKLTEIVSSTQDTIFGHQKAIEAKDLCNKLKSTMIERTKEVMKAK